MTCRAVVSAHAQSGQQADELQIDEQPGHEPDAQEEMLARLIKDRWCSIVRARLPVRSSSKPRNAFCTSSSATTRRYVMVLVSAAMGFNGLGCRISRKAEWPTDSATRDDRASTYLPRFMASGPKESFGGRALYLGSTVYRIHGYKPTANDWQCGVLGCFGLANGEIVICMSACRSGQRSSFGTGRNYRSLLSSESAVNNLGDAGRLI